MVTVMCILKDTVNVVFALEGVLKRVNGEIAEAMSELADIAAEVDNVNDGKLAEVYVKPKKKLINSLMEC